MMSNTQDEPFASTSSETKSPYLITEDFLRERQKQENTGHYITQLCVAIAVAVGAVSFGIHLGWACPEATYLSNTSISTVNYSREMYSWIIGFMPLGCSIGMVPWHYSVYKIGPKHTLMIQIPFYILTLVMLISVKSMTYYLIGRFLSGFLSIPFIIAGEYLLMDSVHKVNLRHMLVWFHSSVYIGVFISYATGQLLSQDTTLIVCACIPALQLIMLLFLPESPVFLYRKSELKAEKALIWLRGRHNIYSEMRSIKKDAEIRKLNTDPSGYMLYSKVVLKALLIILGLIFFQIFTGYYVFMFYTLTLWQEVNNQSNTLKEILSFATFLFLANLCANMLHSYIKFGVRKLILLSITSTAMALLIITIFTFFVQYEIINKQKYTWIFFILVNLFVVCYEIGLGVSPEILLYDYLPFQVHEQAKIITKAWFWFLVFFIGRNFMWLNDTTSTLFCMGLLTIITFIGVFYCYMYIIETKGKSLLQIQLQIGGNPIGNRAAYRSRQERPMYM